MVISYDRYMISIQGNSHKLLMSGISVLAKLFSNLVRDLDHQGTQNWQQRLRSRVQAKEQIRCQHTSLLVASKCLYSRQVHCAPDDCTMPSLQILDRSYKLGWYASVQQDLPSKASITGKRSSMPRDSVCCLWQPCSHSKRRLNRAFEQLLFGLNTYCDSRSCCCSQSFQACPNDLNVRLACHALKDDGVVGAAV